MPAVGRAKNERSEKQHRVICNSGIVVRKRNASRWEQTKKTGGNIQHLEIKTGNSRQQTT